MDAAELSNDTLRALATGWLKKIQLARQHRAPFDDIADQCTQFFSGSTNFMFSEEYQRKFFGGKRFRPRFQICIQKAFELVALFGPTLYARNPVRNVRPHRPVQFGPEVLGDPNDPQVQMMHQQLAGQQQAEWAQKEVACQLMERYLSYTPQEQPGGGLQTAAEDAVTEGLVTGLGLLWPEHYSMPGSDRVLTGCFFDSQANYVVDPDAKSAEFGEAKWIARKRVQPTWEVERKYRLPDGILKGKGQRESVEAQGERAADPQGNMHRETGETFDLLTYWEVYSIGGVGSRLTGMDLDLHEGFEEVTGDYAHLVVADGVSWPLNAPPPRFEEADDEAIKKMFRWPVPYWLDRRWPCARLTFYRKPGSIWPIAPMAPGLGELIFLNVIISHLTNRIWSSSRTLIAVLKSASTNVKKILERGDDLAVFELENIHGDINKVISFLNQPEVNKDVWVIIERMFDLFDRRTGLSEIWYGMNARQGGVDRSARGTQVKEEKSRIRPEHMGQAVSTFMREAARLEKLCAYFSGVEGSDVAPLVGNVGGMLWDRLITQADPETVVREMDCTVEPGSAMRPNKERDQSNINQIYPAMSQELSKHADVTGDTGPINALHKKLGESLEQDMSGLQMGPRTPAPPPPEAQEQMQAEQEAEQQQAQADLAKKQVELQMEATEHGQEMTHSEEEHDQEFRHREEEHDQKIRLAKVQAQVQNRLTRIKAAAGNGRDQQ